LTAIGAPTEGQQALIAEVADLDANAVARGIVAARLPKFQYFDEYNELPGRISVPFLQSADEDTLGTSERTALALLRFAGVEAEDFDESNYEDHLPATPFAGTLRRTVPDSRGRASRRDLRLVGI
jgi:hypothetical protein